MAELATARNQQALLAVRGNAMDDSGGYMLEGIAAFVIFCVIVAIYWIAS